MKINENRWTSMKINENQWKFTQFWICQNLENTMKISWIRRENTVKIRGCFGSADMQNFAKIIGKINGKSMENQWKSMKTLKKSMKINENH